MAKSQNGISVAVRSLMTSSFFLSMLLLCVLAPAQEPTPDVETIIKRIDQLYRSETSEAEMEMHIVTPHWERTLAMHVWTEGMDKTFIRITAPKKEQGVATLRIGNEMWNYLPKTNKVMKIPPSMMMGSWMGSDFTNDDLVRESSMLEDYTYQFVTPKMHPPTIFMSNSCRKKILQSSGEKSLQPCSPMITYPCGSGSMTKKGT